MEGLNTSRLPAFTEEEKRMLKGTSDFFCVNIYDSEVVRNLTNDTISESPTVAGDTGVEYLNVNNVSK